MCSVCPSQKMTKKEKQPKRERTACQTDWTNKKPPEPKRLFMSSVKQRLSPPPSISKAASTLKPAVTKNGWFVSTTRTFQRAEGRAVVLIHTAMRAS